VKRLFSFVLILLLVLVVTNNAPALARKKHQNTQYDEYEYQQKVLRNIEKEKYHRSLLPFSGFMSTEEYEKMSEDVMNSEKVIPEPKLARDIKMKYVPEPTYKLARYNDPPGTPELRISGKFKFNRQENGAAITSPDRSFMVYPVVYYYASNQCTAGDLFVIPLDKTLPDVDRILRASIIKRITVPILSTDKNIDEKFTFRTMTPIDFSPDSTKLIAKEKVGYVFDGIWQTNLWVYDFTTMQSKKIVEVRDAIRYYWKNTKGTVLDDNRWDIYPLGFDSTDPSRIIVNAYGYTGGVPKFLGTWSVDCNGERTLLVSLFNPEAEISINGYKLVKSGIVNSSEVYAGYKEEDKIVKQKRKNEKKARKLKKKQGKQALNKKLKEMKAEEKVVKDIYRKHKKVTAPTALEVTPAPVDEKIETGGEN